MVRESIGLDIGASSIKAVRLRGLGRGRDAISFLQEPCPHPAPGTPHSRAPVNIARQLTEFIASHSLGKTPVSTALPCQDLFLRTLTVPFKDPKKVLQVVPFELEGLIPLGIDDIVLEPLLLPPGTVAAPPEKPSTTDVLVAAVPKATLATHLRVLKDAGIHSASVNVDGLALHAYTRFLAGKGLLLPEECVIIDLGASKTTLCMLRQSRPWMLRTIAWGSDTLTQVLAQKHGGSWEEAERRKLTMTAQQVEPWLEPLLKEIQLTLHAYESTTQTRIWQCFLCGGGAALKGFGPFLSSKLELEQVSFPDELSRAYPPVFAVAIGLAVSEHLRRRWLPLGRVPRIVAADFRLPPDTSPVAAAASRRDIGLAVFGGLVLSLLLLVDLAVRVTLKESNLAEMKKTLQSHYSMQFGGSAPFGEEVDHARGRVETLKKTLALLDEPSPPALPILAELIRRLPTGMTLKIDGISIEKGAMQLEAETDSFESTEKIKQALLTSPSFRNVTMSDVHVGTSAHQVRFRVSMELQRPPS